MKASIAFSALIFCFKADCIRSENNAVVRSVNQHVLLQVKTNVLLQIDNSISHGEHIDSNSIPLQWVLQVDELRFDSTSLGASEDSIRLDERILDVQWQDGGAGTAAYSLLLPLENSTRRSNRPLLIAIWERDLETKSRRFLSQHLTHVPRTAPLPGIPSDQDYSWKPNTVVEMNIKSRYSSIDTRSSKNYETGSSTNYGFWAFVVASVYGLFYLRRDTRAMLVSRRSTDENVELDNECEEAENSNDEADEEMSLNADSNDRDDDERSLSPAFVLLRSSAITSDESDEEEEEDLNLERPPSMERHLIKSFLEKGFPFEDALEKATEKYLMEKNSRTENPVPPVNERTHPLEYNDVLRATPDGASGMNTTSCESVGAPDTLRVCPTMSNPKCSDVPDAGDASGSSRIMQKMLKEASSGEGVCQEIRVNDVKRSPGTIREGVINVETSGGEPMSLVESKNSPATVALASKPRKKRPRTLISSERKKCAESDSVHTCVGSQSQCGSNWNFVPPKSFADKACKRAKSAPSDEEYGGYQSEPIARAKIYCHSDAEDDARVVAEASSMASAGLFEHTQDETTHDNATGKGSTSASLDSGVQENTACEEEDGVSPSSLVVIGPLNVTLTEATRCQALDERSANESADDPQKVIKSSSFSIAAAVPLENCTRPTDSDSLDEDPAQDDKEDEKEHLLLAPAGPLQLDQTEAAHSDILDKDSPDASLESGVQDDAVYGDGFVVIPPSMAAIELHKEGRTEATRSDSSGNVSAPALFDKDQDDTTDSCLASGNELYTLQSADDKTNEMQSTTHQPRTCLVDKPQARFSAPDPPSVRVDQVERTPRASDDESDKLSDAERTFYIPDKISAVQSKAPCSALLGAEPVHVDQVVSALPAEDRVLPDSPYVSTLPPDSCSSYSDSSVDTVRSNGRVEYAKVMLEKSAELKSVAGDDILAEFVPSAALRTAAMAMRDFSFEFEGKGSRAKPLTLKELNDNKKPKRSTRARSDSFGPSKSQAVATRQARTDRGPSHFVSPNPTVQGLMDVTGDNTPALKNLMSPPTTKPLRPKTTDPSTLQTFKVDASKKRRITFDGKPVELSKKMKHVPSDEAFDYKDDAEDPFADKDEFPRPEATRPPTIR
ncbi:hypothetical protein FisN_11Hh240 [Fistulifera solaris]|jgi:hypothetical protein|uniref:Uncharacterized protein n=1 Tax=Fistulifera solaris TaxID=1519565 RepID=A0A1Z5JL41_FISSO|nr:hypothetical protein FisN_11Hh240 [Fistulifera solaris]|eukprot:GAX14699.1 hypothetical protein FisN_11Hh240 [Fistulifera solaris]